MLKLKQDQIDVVDKVIALVADLDMAQFKGHEEILDEVTQKVHTLKEKIGDAEAEVEEALSDLQSVLIDIVNEAED